jgi:hypothetical protein
MKERPILFGEPMVRALLDGSKTQTRRVVKPQPYVDPQGNFCWNGSNFGQDFNGPHIQAIASPLPSSRTGRVLCPYGKPGDRLWVREAWRVIDVADCFAPREITAASRIWYEADAPHQPGFGKYRPSMFIPRWASRITLEITEVRVERLQDISEADALAEGIVQLAEGFGLSDGRHFHATDPRQSYLSLWESINGPSSVEANPWVWVIKFRKL